jgi:hypothetical protein
MVWASTLVLGPRPRSAQSKPKFGLQPDHFTACHVVDEMPQGPPRALSVAAMQSCRAPSTVPALPPRALRVSAPCLHLSGCGGERCAAELPFSHSLWLALTLTPRHAARRAHARHGWLAELRGHRYSTAPSHRSCGRTTASSSVFPCPSSVLMAVHRRCRVCRSRAPARIAGGSRGHCDRAVPLRVSTHGSGRSPGIPAPPLTAGAASVAGRTGLLPFSSRNANGRKKKAVGV